MDHVAELVSRRTQSRLAGLHAHSSLGATGHWIHLLSVAAPLFIGEVIKNPENRWRALRLASVGAAIASEAVWSLRLSNDKKKTEEMSQALRDCAERSP
jgi:hypothetical protein